MKKTTIFFLLIGVLAMIIGGIGSIFYFPQAKRTMTNTKTQQYTIKHSETAKNVHLSISGNADLFIYTDNTKTVQLTTRSSLPTSVKSTFVANEKNNQLQLAVTSTKKSGKQRWMPVNFFGRESSVALRIPSDTEQLTIDGTYHGRVHLASINAKKMALSTTGASLSIEDSNTEELLVDTPNNYVSATDVRADKSDIQAATLTLDRFSSNKWLAKTTDGSISLSTVKGGGTVETTSGDVTVEDSYGETSVKSTNGNFTFNGTELPKQLAVSLQHGDISLSLNQLAYDATIKGTSSLGDVVLFGKKRTTFAKGNGTKKITLQTNTGDISVEGPTEVSDEEDAD